MQEKIEEIKINVEQYKLLLSKKEELEKKYNSWVELYGDLVKELAKVKELYKNDNSEKARLALDESLKEEKEYLEIINDYGARLKAINDEFNTYDHETLETQRQYLANITRFQELSKLMKEIEKRSKKIANGAKIGTNCIKIANAEGRDKNIHEYFAEEYRALSAEKRELAKTIRKQDRILFTEPVKKEEVTVDVINPPKPEVEFDEDYYEKLSPEEKIVELEKRLERMLQARGNKRIIHYKGESIRISEHYYKQYPRIRSEINKLKKEIEERDNQAKDANLTSPYVEELPATDLSSGRTNPFMDLPFNDPRQVGATVDDNPFVGIAQVTPLTPGAKPMYDIPLDDFDKKEASEEDKQFEVENEELLAMVNRHAIEVAKEEEKTKPEEKPKGFLKILNIKKPKSLTNLKEKIKKSCMRYSCYSYSRCNGNTSCNYHFRKYQ